MIRNALKTLALCLILPNTAQADFSLTGDMLATLHQGAEFQVEVWGGQSSNNSTLEGLNEMKIGASQWLTGRAEFAGLDKTMTNSQMPERFGAGTADVQMFYDPQLQHKALREVQWLVGGKLLQTAEMLNHQLPEGFEWGDGADIYKSQWLVGKAP
jgi:hypothetical protein